MPELRRAGWGVYLGPRWAGVSAPLSGPEQNAQRAELRAFVGALELTEGCTTVVTDSAYVCLGARRLAVGAPCLSRHHDLWLRAQALFIPGVTRVEKVKAHLSAADAAAAGMRPDDHHGNMVADRLADAGAVLHPVPEAQRAAFLQQFGLVGSIRTYLARLLASQAEEPPGRLPRRRGPARARPKRAAAPVRAPPAATQPAAPQACGQHARIVRFDPEGARPYWQCLDCSRVLSCVHPWREWRRRPCHRARLTPELRGHVLVETAPGRVRCERRGLAGARRYFGQRGNCRGAPAVRGEAPPANAALAEGVAVPEVPPPPPPHPAVRPRRLADSAIGRALLAGARPPRGDREDLRRRAPQAGAGLPPGAPDRWRSRQGPSA